MKYPNDYINKVLQGDCLEIMKGIPDKSVDLVLTDPPYGIDVAGKDVFGGKGGFGGKEIHNTKHIISDWDKKIPPKEIFNEIFRVSKNQIIFGGNYFWSILPPPMSYLIWDKRCGFLENNFADCEMIWSSFKQPARIIRYLWAGLFQDNMKDKEKRFHPTQKPLSVIKNIINKHTNETNLILDPFLGSGTTAVAAKQLKRNFIGIEISEKYCEIARGRLRQELLL
jgi:site-specific DNA-methyltransferase (adenine-specific)